MINGLSILPTETLTITQGHKETAMYQQMYAHLPFPCLMASQDGILVSLNPCGFALLGIAADSLHNGSCSIWDYIDPLDRADVKQCWHKVLTEPGSGDRWIFRWVDDSQERHWVTATATRLEIEHMVYVMLVCQVAGNPADHGYGLQGPALTDTLPVLAAELDDSDASGVMQPLADASWHKLRSQAWLENILNAIPDPVFVKDENHRWMILNDAYCSLVGRSRQELIGRSDRDVLIPIDAQYEWMSDSQVLSTGHAIEQEEILTDAQGIKRVVVTKKSLFRDSEDRPIIVGTSRDITQQKHVEVTLKRQAERQRLLGAIAQHILQSLNLRRLLDVIVREVRKFLQTDRVIFYSFDSDYVGVVAESCEATFPSMLGHPLENTCFDVQDLASYQKGEVQGYADINQKQFPPEQRQRLQHYAVKASLVIPIIQGEKLWGLVFAHHCRETRQWQEWEVESLRELATQVGSAIQQTKLYEQVKKLNADLEREVEHRTQQLRTALEFEATLKRITDRVRDSLDETQILQTAVKELTSALGVKGSNTSVYDLEQGTSTIYYEYNTTSPSIQGRVAQMEAFPEVYHQLLEGQDFQFCSIIPNPVRGRVAMLACPMRDDRGVLGDLWLINDHYYGYTELEIRLVQQVANQCAIAIRQARLYQAAQSQVEQLERLNNLKDDFLSTVSHELRTPVTSMRVALQLLGVTLNQEFNLDEELIRPKAQQGRIARYYQILQEECEREISLINDLLDLQRLDVGNHPINPQSINVPLWLPDVVNGFQARAKSRQQVLNIEIDPNLPLLTSDLASLERILAELLNNACKYTPPGGTITLHAQCQSLDDMQFDIQNTGVEIPPQELSRIFDKFYRVPSADPWKQGGTGLGLALVQRLLTHLGGSIQVTSENKETCFTVKVPLAFPPVS